MAREFMRGKVICAAVRLGIPDALGEGKSSLEELAAATSTDLQSLHRLLRALAGMGIVAETGPGSFQLTQLGEPLRRNAPHSVWASIIFWSDLLADFWTYLPECIKAGGGATAVSAMEKLGVKSRWSLEPDAQAIFHHVFAEPDADDMAPHLAAYDFARHAIVADLGGAGGGLLTAILTQNPQAQGTLVDRQEALVGAAQSIKAAGLSDRCRLVAADLLESVPAGADLYVLKSVLHGYRDDDARRILQNCRKAMKPESTLLVIEIVLPDTIPAPDPQIERMLLADLNMLTVTGGRERTRFEWEALLSSAQLKLQQVHPVPGAPLSMLEALC